MSDNKGIFPNRKYTGPRAILTDSENYVDKDMNAANCTE